MKPLSVLLLLLLGSVVLGDQPMSDTITAAALAEKQSVSPLAQLEPLPEDDAALSRTEEPDLIAQSTLLRFGEYWTLVPKGAVIHLPALLKDRVIEQPEGQYLPWLDFLGANRGWLSTAEVTLEQASGELPIDPAKIAFWTRQDKVMVAVYQRGPISIAESASLLTQTP
jgi:hypothetical protein